MGPSACTLLKDDELPAAARLDDLPGCRLIRINHTLSRFRDLWGVCTPNRVECISGTVRQGAIPSLPRSFAMNPF